MAQSIEITEKVNNGSTNKTAVTKSLNVAFIDSVTANGVDDSEIFVAGRGTKDVRICDESYATVVAAINAAPTADVERIVDLTVINKVGNLPRDTYSQGFSKSRIVEFYADLQDPTNTVVIIEEGENDMERDVYIVDETYAAIKASFNA